MRGAPQQSTLLISIQHNQYIFIYLNQNVQKTAADILLTKHRILHRNMLSFLQVWAGPVLGQENDSLDSGFVSLWTATEK